MWFVRWDGIVLMYNVCRTGVRAAVDWLFIRVQNSRRSVALLPSWILVQMLISFIHREAQKGINA